VAYASLLGRQRSGGLLFKVKIFLRPPSQPMSGHNSTHLSQSTNGRISVQVSLDMKQDPTWKIIKAKMAGGVDWSDRVPAQQVWDPKFNPLVLPKPKMGHGICRLFITWERLGYVCHEYCPKLRGLNQSRFDSCLCHIGSQGSFPVIFGPLPQKICSRGLGAPAVHSQSIRRFGRVAPFNHEGPRGEILLCHVRWRRRKEPKNVCQIVLMMTSQISLRRKKTLLKIHTVRNKELVKKTLHITAKIKIGLYNCYKI
jgi:hypothetical protein